MNGGRGPSSQLDEWEEIFLFLSRSRGKFIYFSGSYNEILQSTFL